MEVSSEGATINMHWYRRNKYARISDLILKLYRDKEANESPEVKTYLELLIKALEELNE